MRMSMPPNVSSALATKRLHWSESETSILKKIADPPSDLAKACPHSTFRSAMTTLAPSATKRCASAAPCPLAPPVTMAAFPLSLSLDPPCPFSFMTFSFARRAEAAVLPIPALTPQEAVLVPTRVVWVEIDMHAADQGAAELEDAAETATRRLAAAPPAALYVHPLRLALDDDDIGRGYIGKGGH